MAFNFEIFAQFIWGILKYAHVTLSLTLYTFAISILLGTCMALILVHNMKILKPIVQIWISFFRGTPLVAQFFFIYFGLSQLFKPLAKIPSYPFAVIILSLHYSAYMAVTIAGAIQSVDKGQWEACYSTGMTQTQTMFRIVIPQATLIAIPALSNSFLDIVKGTSLAFTISVVDMMAKATMLGAEKYRFLEAYTAVILIYWIIYIIFSLLQKIFEKKLRKAY